jgi:hypothetical protein
MQRVRRDMLNKQSRNADIQLFFSLWVDGSLTWYRNKNEHVILLLLSVYEFIQYYKAHLTFHSIHIVTQFNILYLTRNMYLSDDGFLSRNM